MKKIILFMSVCMIAGITNAQTLKSDGTMNDSHGNTIGYFKSNGTVEDSHHNTIGYIKSNGTVEDSHHNTIGYIKSDGTIEDSHHSTIKKASGNTNEVALKQFFFKS